MFKNKMVPFINGVVCLVFLVTTAVGQVSAQGNQPPDPETPPMYPDLNFPPIPGAQYRQDEGWYMDEIAQNDEMIIVDDDSGGGPDLYGYTYSSMSSWSWVDATSGGTVLNISEGSNDSLNVDLGFNFKFYENTYSSINVSVYGYASFDTLDFNDSQSDIPAVEDPNNVIAPYWTPTDVSSSGSSNRVYIKRDGEGDNQRLIIEWYAISYDDDTYTFEAILNENGGIQFQYGTMKNDSSGYFCGVSGIEDQAGQIGLNTFEFCHNAESLSNTAIQITRPAEDARVRIFPLEYGRLSSVAAKVDYQLDLKNVGDLGTDTFDLSTSSSWTVELFDISGTIELTDTNDNGIVDTGPIDFLDTFQVIVRVSTPDVVNIGDHYPSTIVITPENNPSQTRTITLSTTIPAPFASIATDYSDGAINLLKASPRHTVVQNISPFSYGAYPTVIETPNHSFFTAWVDGRCVNSDCDPYVGEIYYSLAGHSIEYASSPVRLNDLSGSTENTYIYYPSLTPSSDGRIGLVWVQRMSYSEGSEYYYNENVFFSVVDQNGTIIKPATQITSNSNWYSYSDDDSLYFDFTSIAPAGNDHFVLAWQQTDLNSDGVIQNVYSAVVDTNGNTSRSPGALTDDSRDFYYNGYLYPQVTGLMDGSVLILIAAVKDTYLHGYILDNNGDVTTEDHIFQASNINFDYYPDAIQLVNGNIAVVWIEYMYNGDQHGDTLRFMLLDSNLNQLVTPTSLLPDNTGIEMWYPSITADSGNHIIVTAGSNTGNYLYTYYALLNGDGTLLQNLIPIQDYPEGFSMSYGGGASTSYSPLQTTVSDTDIFLTADSLVGVAPGGQTQFTVEFSNRGLQASAGGSLQVTFDEDLMVDEISGLDLDANQFTYDFSNLSYLGVGRQTYTITLPNDPIGTKYPIEILLTADGDTETSNNSIQAVILSALQFFIPEIIH